MKNLFLTLKLLSVVVIISLISSCGGDDASITTTKNNFDYQISDLIGIWETTAVLDSSSGEWYAVDGSVSGYSIFSFKVRFNDDYSYLLDGVTTNESGTYTANGSLIVTYINGVQQAEYDVKSLNSSTMELMLIRGTDATTYSLSKIW